MVLVMLCPAPSPRMAKHELFTATWDPRCDFFFPGQPPLGSPGLSSAGEGSHQVSMPHGSLWESSTSEAASGPLSIPDCSLCSRGPAHPLPSCSGDFVEQEHHMGQGGGNSSLKCTAALEILGVAFPRA